MKFLLTVIAATGMLALSGCTTTAFVKTGNYTAAPRIADCDFSIFTKTPSSPFKEVGLISFYTGVGATVSTIDGTKREAQKFVCENGGNGIILPEPDRGGLFERATVIWMDKQ